ncbi:FAD-binding protein [Brevibacterium sp. UCMA 11754]|uniref:FAD-binding protein n=1 Tax=Brevibacterium sp. UCMA 11754 TaxID=2749198 RepID=UPI002E1E95F7
MARSHSVPITSRGGGTSQAGNAIGTGVVIDFSRHLNRVPRHRPRRQDRTWLSPVFS